LRWSIEVDPRADRGLPGIPQTMLDAQGKPQYNLSYISPANANANYSLKPGWTLNGAKPADAAPVYTMPSQIAPSLSCIGAANCCTSLPRI
jgi:hypothetical protein